MSGSTKCICVLDGNEMSRVALPLVKQSPGASQPPRFYIYGEDRNSLTGGRTFTDIHTVLSAPRTRIGSALLSSRYVLAASSPSRKHSMTMPSTSTNS
jgi:hypothetical protein